MRGHGSIASPPLLFVRVGGGGRRCRNRNDSGCQPSAANPAGDPAAVAKVTNLNKKALEAYAQQDYDSARDLLKQALELCDSAGLDQHPITARTHVHFGVVAIVGFKNREVGLKQFRKALEIEPDIKLTKSLVTPELQDAFEEAVLAGDKGGGGAPRRGGGDNAGARQCRR